MKHEGDGRQSAAQGRLTLLASDWWLLRIKLIVLLKYLLNYSSQEVISNFPNFGPFNLNRPKLENLI